MTAPVQSPADINDAMRAHMAGAAQRYDAARAAKLRVSDAAPDLLAALKRLLAVVDRAGLITEATNDARAAIAKAEP